MNPLNYFPKVINVKDYVGKYDEHLLVDGEKAYLTLMPAFDKDINQFKLAYTMYGYEGGAVAYLPFTQEDIKEREEYEFSFIHSFDGGFTGTDVDELVEHMGIWLTENKFM